jgi:hypothetical protein
MNASRVGPVDDVEPFAAFRRVFAIDPPELLTARLARRPRAAARFWSDLRRVDLAARRRGVFDVRVGSEAR